MSEIIQTKRCSKCKDFKPLFEFHKNCTRKDGHQYVCKTCQKHYQQSERGKTIQHKAKIRYRQTEHGQNTQKVYQKKYRKTEKGKDAHRKGDIRYYQTEHGRTVRLKTGALYCQTEHGKNVRKNYRQSKEGKAAQKRFRIRHPEQCKAKDAVKYAINAGKLPHPNTLQCHYCPAQAEEYHHFLGYAPEHWFDVIPVCRKCHPKSHSEISNSGIINKTVKGNGKSCWIQIAPSKE